MTKKIEKDKILKSSFLVRKDELTNEIISVIAPNGLQVGLKGQEGASSDLLVTGATTLNDLTVTGTFIFDELDIISDNVTTDVVNITADSLTTANVIATSADALTTGGIMNLVSDSSSTSSRSLVTIKNDNTAATATTLLHLINDSTSASSDMIIESTDSGATAGPKLRFARSSTSPDVDDLLGKILFTGKDDAGNTTLYASMRAEINDETHSGGQEDGVIVFDIIKNNSQKSALELKNNEAVFNNSSADIDFRIESDDATHMFFLDANNNRISIGNTTDDPAAVLEVVSAANAGVPAVIIDNDDTDEFALHINAANIDASAVVIEGDAITTAYAMNVSADALTTGGILNLISDSPAVNARTLVTVKNDNTAATGTVVMHLVNDAIGGFDDPILLIESTANETHPVLELKNSNASTTGEPIMIFTRSDTSAEADDMSLGSLIFRGVDDSNGNEYYAQIKAFASDVTTGDEGGLMTFLVKAGGTAGTAANTTLLSIGGEDRTNTTPCEVTVNEDGIDCNFRVESDGATHMLFVDGGNNRVSIGSSVDDPAAVFEVQSPAAAGVPAVIIDNDDTDQIAVQINAANIDASALVIDGDALTTAYAMNVSADALTTGGILNLVSDSSSTGDRTLVTVKNDNTAATGTVVMHLINDAIGGAGDPVLLIESTAAETHAILELMNSNAATDTPPILRFHRSSDTVADDMQLGQITFIGEDSAGATTNYFEIIATATDVTNGDEGGKLAFRCNDDGTMRTALTIGGYTAASPQHEVVVNEGSNSCDFRVESDAEDEAIFLDASAETLYINKGETAFTTQIHNTNDVAITVNADGVTLNDDGNATFDFRVETDNNATMFYVGGTADVVSVGGKSSHHDADFAVFNDYHSATFENRITDGDYGSAEILKYSPGADDTLTVGQLYFLHTDGTWNSTDADAVATGASQMLCVGLGAARTVGVLVRGFVRIPSTEILNVPGSGAVDGLPVYISTTAGHFDFTAPSASGDFVRIVGYAIDDDSGDVLVYFNPDATFVEIA